MLKSCRFWYIRHLVYTKHCLVHAVQLRSQSVTWISVQLRNSTSLVSTVCSRTAGNTHLFSVSTVSRPLWANSSLQTTDRWRLLTRKQWRHRLILTTNPLLVEYRWTYLSIHALLHRRTTTRGVQPKLTWHVCIIARFIVCVCRFDRLAHHTISLALYELIIIVSRNTENLYIILKLHYIDWLWMRCRQVVAYKLLYDLWNSCPSLLLITMWTCWWKWVIN